MTNSAAAGRVRIYIATTAGPVHVQRITEEDPEVASVVCLAGKAVALPISGAYDAFVRDPTGVIQRRFGHGAYRTDVSAPVDEGYSWQLALYLAHAARAGGGLAADDDTTAPAVIATGEVDRDLNILPVDHVAAKLDRLDARFDAALVLVPHGNAADAGDRSVLAVASVADALAAAGLNAPTPSARPATRQPAPEPAAVRGRTWHWVALVLFLLLGGAAAWALSGPPMDWLEMYSEGRAADLHRALHQTQGPRAQAARALLAALRPSPDRVQLRVDGTGAGLAFRAEAPAGVFLSGRGLVWLGNVVDVRRPDQIVYLDPRPGALAWKPEAAAGAQYRLVVLASRRPITGPQSWFPALGALGMPGPMGERAAEVAERLAGVGITVKAIDRRLPLLK